MLCYVMGRKDGNSASGGGTFRNPHNLPVKDCVTCGKPFTWRKKWEKCWDEVLTCSQRCKTDRRSQIRSGGKPECVLLDDTASPGEQSKRVTKHDQSSGAEDDIDTGVHEVSAGTDLQQQDGADASLQDLLTAEKYVSDQQKEAAATLEADSEDESRPQTSEVPMSASEARRLHKQAVKAMKSERRAQRSGCADAANAKHKPCDECNKPVDLLIRCTTDEFQQWRMLCGGCWKKASGGVPDGDADHPHYRYGGLWKNRAATVTSPNFGAKA